MQEGNRAHLQFIHTFSCPRYLRRGTQCTKSLLAVDQLVNARDGNERNTGSCNGRKVFLMSRQIGSHSGIFCGDPLLLEAADLSPDITKISLKVIDLGFIRESITVTGKNR